MKRNYSQPKSNERVYRRLYSGFRGVDFADPPIFTDITRAVYAKNAVTDHAGVIHKRQGWTKMYNNTLNRQIHLIAPVSFSKEFTLIKTVAGVDETYHIKDFLLVHEQSALYVHYGENYGSVAQIDYAVNNADSRGFQQGDRFFLFDGENFLVIYIDDETMKLSVKRVYEIATAPETQIAGYYYAEEYTDENDQPQIEYTWTFGEEGERNLLTGRRINTFCGDAPAESPAVAHKTFYLDKPNFAVYKVEMYAPSAGITSADGKVTAKPGTSNIRNRASMDGRVIGYAANPATTNAPSVFTCLGQVGSWYKIQVDPSKCNGNTEGYIHSSRVTYTPPSGSTEAVSLGDWTEIPEDDATYGWTVAEATSGDAAQNCTKITFTTAPPAHPRGHGLPNIRVTGAATEVASADGIGNGQNNVVVTIPKHMMMTKFIDVRINGGSPLSDEEPNPQYKKETAANGNLVVTVYGIVNNVQQLHTGDLVQVSYRRESLEDIDLVGTCKRFGRYGEYNTDRMFYTGNGDYPNRDWYSEPSDPTLVLENSYTDIGNTNSEIAGYLNYQSDMLIVKIDGAGENLFRRTATTDGDLTIFPVKAYEGRGALNDRCLANIKGQCFYLSPEGLYEFVSSDLNSKYSVQDRDYLVKRKMIAESDYKSAELVPYSYGGYLIVALPSGNCYVADTNQRTAPALNGGNGFEWFYWDNMQMRLAVQDKDKLWFAGIGSGSTAANNAKLCVWPNGEYSDYPTGYGTLTNRPIDAIWQTPYDQLDEPALYKYIDRRGMIVQLEEYPGYPIIQRFHMAIVTDGGNVFDEIRKTVKKDETSTNYTYNALTPQWGAVPFITVDRRIPRFKYIQFIFTNSDPECDGFGMLTLEFQYRYGRAIIGGADG